MASQEQVAVLNRHPHRLPLGVDHIEALYNLAKTLRNALGEDKAAATPVYSAILRLLKAHISPVQGASVTFAQVHAVKLQVLAEKLLAEGKDFPPELMTAIRQGLVAGFDRTTGLKISTQQRNAQLVAQQMREREEILREKANLQDLQADFRKARTGMVTREDKQQTPEQDYTIPWNERTLPVRPDSFGRGRFALLDGDLLMSERNNSLKRRTEAVVEEVGKSLREHESGKSPLHPRTAALLESRARHSRLLALQRNMQLTIWNEHRLAEREGKRGSKGRVRSLKQLQREFEKVERSRVRQLELEEKDARRKRQAWMNAMIDHLNKFRGYHRDVVRRGVKAVTKAVLKYHEEVARNASRAEREAEKARIQKLKDDDEEGYLELVRKTKNTRLLELLDQTDKYLRELGAVVKEERVKSGVVEYENNASDKPGTRQDYYEIAHAIKEEVSSQSSLLVGGTLKEYQLHGIQWMLSLYNNRLNGILADEMGLGKTIQTLGLIAHLMERKDNPGPYLIIVPLSTISNWELEFARWAPAIRVVVFKGDAKARKRLYEDVIEKKSFNVCLVTYEYVVRGKTFLKRLEWQHLIIDEGHRIKNHESRLSAVLHDHYRSRNRLLLTGTPLQNSLTELWALLNFLLPNVFKSAESFESWFAAPFAQMGVGNISASEQQAQLTEEESLLIIRRLHQVLRPFLLRRMKSDVLRMGEQLPDKQEHVVLCEMSAWQRFMYLKIVKADRLLFTDRHGRQRYDKLSNPAVQLRKCVNHPYLFFPDHASRIVDTPELWRASGKFDMLDSIVTKLLRTGHRLLIFNQMTKVVDLQERLLRYRNISFYRLDGSTSTDDRKKMVNDFNNADSDVHVFLLTTRAGGLGVNLQTADTVIIFDSDWNPSMDQQAQDRAHRIGQRREVLVLRMITAKSIEEDVMERASFKRGLEKKIIKAGMFDEQSKDSERQAMLRELLRVEGPVSDDEQEDGLPTEEEINRILARSEEEFGTFMEIDEERKFEISPRQRLMLDNEIPEWATKVPKALLQKSKLSGAGNWNNFETTFDLSTLNEPKKRRAATTNVSYGLDQLSERQYIKLMERSEAGEEVSLADAMKAVSRRKRRRKERAVSVSRDDDGDTEREKRRDSRDGKLTDGEQNSVRDIVRGSPERNQMVASKTLNADLKSIDDDMTEGGNGTGGEQSFAPSGTEDMVLDDDDDDDEAGGGEDNGLDELGDSRQEAGAELECPTSRSEEGGSDSSDEDEVERPEQAAVRQGKTPSKKWTQSARQKPPSEERRRRAGREAEGRRAKRKNGKAGERHAVPSRSESSGESRRGMSARKFPQRSSSVNREDDDISTESEQKKVIAGGRIPRRAAPRITSSQGNEKETSKPRVSQVSERWDTGEIDEGMEMDEAEDGEIREDGEVFNVEVAPKRSRVAPINRFRSVQASGPGVSSARPPRSESVDRRIVQHGEKERIVPAIARSRYPVSWLTGGYGQGRGRANNARAGRREPGRPFGRVAMAQMGRADATFGMSNTVSEVGEDEADTEEEGEIVEDQ